MDKDKLLRWLELNKQHEFKRFKQESLSVETRVEARGRESLLGTIIFKIQMGDFN